MNKLKELEEKINDINRKFAELKKEECEFKKGDIVMVRDGDSESWELRFFEFYESNDAYPYFASLKSNSRGLKYKQCKHPDIPNIRIPWHGGECPVANGTKITYWMESGVKVTDKPQHLDWSRETEEFSHDITDYMLMPEEE